MSIFSAIRYAAVFVGMSLACVPLAEVTFRLAGDQPSDDLAGLFAPFRDGGYKLAVGLDTSASWVSGKFSVHTDGLGLRCDSGRRLAARPQTTVNAMFLGDSQGFGNGVNFEDTIAGAFAQLGLAEQMRVVNASVGGHGVLNQLALARWLRDEHGVSAANYILLATPLMVQNPLSFRQTVVGSDGRLYESEDQSWARVRVWLRTHTVLYNRWRDAVRNAGLGDRPATDVNQVFDLYGARSDDTAATAAFLSLLQVLQRFANETRARLLVVYVPLTVEAEFDSMRQAGAARQLQLDPNRPARICAEACRAAGIASCDLRPVLNALRVQGDPLRLKGDFHYDRLLSKACGEFLWDRLKSDLRPLGYAALPHQLTTTHEN